MPEIFVNRDIDREQPGFSDTRDFFMNRTRDSYDAMLGNDGELPLPSEVFLNSLGIGLTTEDAAALKFLYGSIIDYTKSKNVTVDYDREGWPEAVIKGDNFPHSRVTLDMSFLMNGKMGWRGWVASDRLVLPAYSTGDLRKLITGSNVKVDETGFFKEAIGEPDLVGQLSKYPDLTDILRHPSAREEDSFDAVVAAVTPMFGSGWSFDVYTPPTPQQSEIFNRYGVYRYLATVDGFALPTLNHIVDEVKQVLPEIESTFVQAREQFAK